MNAEIQSSPKFRSTCCCILKSVNVCFEIKNFTFSHLSKHVIYGNICNDHLKTNFRAHKQIHSEIPLKIMYYVKFPKMIQNLSKSLK